MLDMFAPQFQLFNHVLEDEVIDIDEKDRMDYVFQRFHPPLFKSYVEGIQSLSDLAKFTPDTIIDNLLELYNTILFKAEPAIYAVLLQSTQFTRSYSDFAKPLCLNFGLYMTTDLLVAIIQKSGTCGKTATLSENAYKLCSKDVQVRIPPKIYQSWSILLALTSMEDFLDASTPFVDLVDKCNNNTLFTLISRIRLDAFVDLGIHFLEDVVNVFRTLQRKKALTNNILNCLSSLVSSVNFSCDALQKMYNIVSSERDVKLKDGIYSLTVALFPHLPGMESKAVAFFKKRVYAHADDPKKVERSLRLFWRRMMGGYYSIAFDEDLYFIGRTGEYAKEMAPTFMSVFFKKSDFSVCPQLFQDVLIHLASIDFSYFVKEMLPQFLQLQIKDPRFIAILSCIPKINSDTFKSRAISDIEPKMIDQLNIMMRGKVCQNLTLLKPTKYQSVPLKMSNPVWRRIDQSNSKVKQFLEQCNITNYGTVLVKFNKPKPLKDSSVECALLESIPFLLDESDYLQGDILERLISLTRHSDRKITFLALDCLKKCSAKSDKLASEIVLVITRNFHKIHTIEMLYVCVTILDTVFSRKNPGMSVHELHDVEFIAVIGLTSMQPITRSLAYKLIFNIDKYLDHHGVCSLIHKCVQIVEMNVKQRIAPKARTDARILFTTMLSSHYYDIWLMFLAEILSITISANYTPLLTRFDTLMKPIIHEIVYGKGFNSPEASGLFMVYLTSHIDKDIYACQNHSYNLPFYEPRQTKHQIFTKISVAPRNFSEMDDTDTSKTETSESKTPPSTPFAELTPTRQLPKSLSTTINIGDLNSTSSEFDSNSSLVPAMTPSPSLTTNTVKSHSPPPSLQATPQRSAPRLPPIPPTDGKEPLKPPAMKAARRQSGPLPRVVFGERIHSKTPSPSNDIISTMMTKHSAGDTVGNAPILPDDISSNNQTDDETITEYSFSDSSSDEKSANEAKTHQSFFHQFASIPKSFSTTLNRAMMHPHTEKAPKKTEKSAEKVPIKHDTSHSNIKKDASSSNDPAVSDQPDDSSNTSSSQVPYEDQTYYKFLRVLISSPNSWKDQLCFSFTKYIDVSLAGQIAHLFCSCTLEQMSDATTSLLQLLQSPSCNATVIDMIRPELTPFFATVHSFLFSVNANSPRNVKWTPELEYNVMRHITTAENYCGLVRIIIRKSVNAQEWTVSGKELVLSFLLNWIMTTSPQLKVLREKAVDSLVTLTKSGPILTSFPICDACFLSLFMNIELSGKRIMAPLLQNQPDILLAAFCEMCLLSPRFPGDVYFDILFVIFGTDVVYTTQHAAYMLLIGIIAKNMQHPKAHDFLEQFKKHVYKSPDFLAEVCFREAFKIFETDKQRNQMREIIAALRQLIPEIRLLPNQTTCVADAPDQFRVYTPYQFLVALMGASEKIENEYFAMFSFLWLDLLQSHDHSEIVSDFIMSWQNAEVKSRLLFFLITQRAPNVFQKLCERCKFAYYLHYTTQGKTIQNEKWTLEVLTRAFEYRSNLIPHITPLIHSSLLYANLGETTQLLNVFCKQFEIHVPRSTNQIDLMEVVNLFVDRFSEAADEDDIVEWGAEALKWLFGSTNIKIATLSFKIFNRLKKPVDETVISGVLKTVSYYVDLYKQEPIVLAEFIKESFIFFSLIYPEHEQLSFDYAAAFLDCPDFPDICRVYSTDIFVKCLHVPIVTKEPIDSMIPSIIRPHLSSIEQDEKSRQLFSIFAHSKKINELELIVAPLQEIYGGTIPMKPSVDLINEASETILCKTIENFALMIDSASEQLAEKLFQLTIIALKKTTNENIVQPLARLYNAALNYIGIFPAALEYIRVLTAAVPKAATKNSVPFTGLYRTIDDVSRALNRLIRKDETVAVTLTDCSTLASVESLIRSDTKPKVLPFTTQQDILESMSKIQKPVTKKSYYIAKRSDNTKQVTVQVVIDKNWVIKPIRLPTKLNDPIPKTETNELFVVSDKEFDELYSEK